MANSVNNKATLANPSSAPTHTPLTEGPDALKAALAAARQKQEAELFKGEKQVLAHRFRRELTTDPGKRVRFAQNALVAAALAAYSAHGGAKDGWTDDMKVVHSRGASAAEEATIASPVEYLAEAIEPLKEAE